MTNAGQPRPEDHEPEHYEVPPKLTLKDSLGIIAALLALAVIGVLGYIWLTPGMSFGKLLGRETAGAQADAQPAAPTTPAGDSSGERASCEYCGMYADQSASYVVASWTNGEAQHFDSWDCAFNFAKEHQLELTSAEVSAYGGEIGSPDWLKADAAWYLYQTDEPVAGSMPPYVAAFATQTEAQTKQAELGGAVVDFATLRSKWQ